MATILLAWELGEGLSHAHCLLRVGSALAVHGHQIICAFCNVVEPWPLLKTDSFPVLQAPIWTYRPRPNAPPFLASTLADVLAVRGWESVQTLLPLVESWQHMLDLVQPQLIVADYSPTLCLAAYGSAPIVQVGAWFEMPPVHGPEFPVLVRGAAPVMPQQDLLGVAQDVQGRRRKPIPPTLTSILAAGDRFPMSLPQLDPYHAERREPLWDPFEPLAALAPPDPDRRFFAYLAAEYPNVEACLTHMAMTGERGTVYLRSAPADMKERLRLQGLTVLDEPTPLGDVLAQSAVIVHHGGSTTANSAFASGRPQILFPQHLEQTTTAQILARLGVGVALTGKTAPDAAARALRQVMDDRRFADTAATWGRRLHDMPRRPTLPAVVECCLARLAYG